jgi:hypothetical protein
VFYTNTLSIPPMLLLAWTQVSGRPAPPLARPQALTAAPPQGELNGNRAVNLSVASVVALIASCVCGVGISYSGW